jgi:hypothetical protein
LERRRDIRFGFRVPVHFRWTDRDGVVHAEKGFSRDISTRGVYVYAEWHPQAGAEMDVDIILRSSTEGKGALYMSGRGKVIRVEPTGTDGHSGAFVAESKFYSLGRNQKL